MKRGTIWGREVCMQGGPIAYVVYRKAFGGDLARDILDAYRDGDVTVEQFLRFAWTMARTHDPATSDYEAWLGEFDPEMFSLADSPVEVIDSAICAELFRIRPTGRAARLAKRIRGALSRWLGRLSQRLGAA